MYRIRFTKTALRQMKSYESSDLSISRRIAKALNILQTLPNYPGLRTHKVHTSTYGEHFSSRVTGDIRIFWNYYEDNLIRILAIEDHSAY